MYHFFVRRKIRYLLGCVKRGEWDTILAQFTPDAEHWFSGDHALSGARHSPELIASWYKRLALVFPGLWFETKKVAVSGPPWRTHVVIEFVDHVKDRQGKPLPNQGILLFTLRWGKACELHIYCDTQELRENLAILESQGVTEAAERPIQDSLRA